MNEQKQPMQAEREYGPLETAAPVVLNPNAPAAPASALAGSGFWRRLWALVDIAAPEQRPTDWLANDLRAVRQTGSSQHIF